MFCWELVALSVPIPLRVHGYFIRSSSQKSVLRKSNRFDGRENMFYISNKKTVTVSFLKQLEQELNWNFPAMSKNLV